MRETIGKIITLILVAAYNVFGLFKISTVQQATLWHALPALALLPVIVCLFSSKFRSWSARTGAGIIKYPRVTQAVLTGCLTLYLLECDKISLYLREGTLLIPNLIFYFMEMNEQSVHQEKGTPKNDS